MSGSVSDLNLSARSSQGGAAQGEGECKLPSETEIFRLFYPDGHIPVEHLGNLSEMRSHVSALLSLASGRPGPKIQRKILSREGSQAINQQIAHLKDTPKEDGRMRTWSEIAQMVGWGISENACHKRYRAWKKQLKHQQQTDRAALRSAAGTEEAAIPEAADTMAVQERSSDQVQQEFEQVVRPDAALQERPEPDENQAIPEDNIAKGSEEVATTKRDPGNGEGPLPDGRRVQGIITGSRLSKRKGKGAEAAPDETLRNVPAASNEVQQKKETAPCRQELQETKPVQSHEAQDLEPKAPQNSKQVVPTAARAPKIPHSEDEFILTERAGGKKFREIHEALEARGIKCKLDDVITRHYGLLKKGLDSPKAESKAPELQQFQAEPAPASEQIQPAPPGVSPEELKWILDLAEKDWSAEEISQELSQNGVSLSAEQVAEILAGSKKEETVKKPEPKRFRKGELDAMIWRLHTKEQLSPEEISARLQEDGYSYEVGTIRARLKAQGAGI